MDAALDRLAALAGIERAYTMLTGTHVHVPDAAIRGILRAMGIACENEREIAASIDALGAAAFGPMAVPEGVRCHVPDWLADGRCWGVACQLYGLQSDRNAGIGDFEDLARFAEIVAAAGGDFVGVNPLHALMLAAPEGCSPFWPSNRRFLNPLYIALDKAPGAERLGDALDTPAAVRETPLVDYATVGPIKRRALGFLFRIFADLDDDAVTEDFQRFIVDQGEGLYLHGLFEALSERMADEGQGPTWTGWPEAFQHPQSDAVREFAAENAALIAFHSWLQWLAFRQLGEVQERARAAGMRIGLYLDLAVGVAPDGSATWSDRELIVPGARIGAPPDYFNAGGQDWGLAPVSPAVLAERHIRPIREALDTVLRHAGALRIDHAMSLYRLFWIAEGFPATEGAYVRYPFADMVRAFAELSQARQAIVIGEDLGIVPDGFRECMGAAEIQGYRVFFFEKADDHFLPAATYPRQALACITTHDTQTLGGWWSAHDLAVRDELGMVPPGDIERLHAERAHERRRLLGLLDENGLLPPELRPAMRDEAAAPAALPATVAVALHRYVATTPSRLFVAAAEDLVGAVDQVNIPGTVGEHPNWRRKLGCRLDDLATHPLFAAVTAALREERPRTG